MASYAAVSSLSQNISLVLNYHQQSISPQFKNQIISLHKHIYFLQSFLEDAPDRANNWEETIREIADRGEDIMELLLSDSLLGSTVGSSKSKYEVQYGFDELERVTEEIESIANQVKGGTRIEAMGGCNDEVMEIISRLCGGSSELEIIPIYGTGGMGKTTLARNAYNHPLTADHFDIRAWSTATRDYIPRRILLELLRSMNKLNAVSISNAEHKLIESVCENLRGMRYLIVLDDVWSFDALERLTIILPDNRNGSRIILTTRSCDLAKSAGLIHEMRFLDEDETWDLLRQKIFKGDPCPSRLEYVGKEIARSSGGHPLSIEVVSGILAADQTEAAWEDISDNMKKISSENVDTRHFQVLSLSYTYLPHHLRPCFLYLGCFPEDHEIRVSKLIKLWVAEGFLNQSGSKSFEETGEEHVEDLVRRSLVSVCRRKSNGKIKSIAIHDVMWDLCLRQAHKDNFILDHLGRFHSFYDRQGVAVELQSCRRVSTSIHGDHFLEIVYSSTIRTIILYLDKGRQDYIRWSMGNVRLLRILDLSNAYKYGLPEEVFELFHLRYLAFHSGFSISNAISNLQNLQTLIICPRENEEMFRMFDKLPEGIWRMPQLRHLSAFFLGLPSHKGETSALENLQTLSVVDFICSIENFKMIPNLKKLCLASRKDNQLYNLIYLQKLEILKIKADDCLKKLPMIIPPAFPLTLKKLSLSRVGFSWEDMKTIASLPNLQVLKLRNKACIGERWETSEGGFSQLTYLLIDESNLEHWITASRHFPRLKCLVLRQCLYLREVQNNVGEIRTLELIEVDYCNWSLLISLKQVQEDRQSLGNDPFKLVLCEGTC